MIDIRSPSPDEFLDFIGAMTGPFGFDLPEEADARTQLLDRMRRLHEPDRSRCAYDGDRIVGTLGALSFEMSVPGGLVPVAGTTQVTVQVTHRRQGVLSSMIRAHLDEAREHGDVAAALWASDSAIYGRFGFGMAAHNTEVEIDRRHVAFHRLAPDPAVVEIVDVDAVRPAAIEVYERLRRQVPGMMSRSDAWWDRSLSDTVWSRDGASRARWALATEGGRPVGWAKYRVKDEADDDHPSQDVIASQLFADTPGGWAGLWNHVLSHDFGRTIRGRHRPVDDPIHGLLRGPRRARTRIQDGLWVRPLDVGRLLSARRYGTDGSITFEVRDPLDLVSGRYRLDVEGGSGTVTSGGEPQVSLDVEDLGALSLGGRSAMQLSLAGRVTGDFDAVVMLDRLLRSDRAPWCPEVF